MFQNMEMILLFLMVHFYAHDLYHDFKNSFGNRSVTNYISS